MTRDEYRLRMASAPQPPPPWLGRGDVPVSTWRAWWLACDLRACGLVVSGAGSRLTVAHGLRTADVDAAGRTWTTEARRVAWRMGADDDLETALDVVMWLVEQEAPEWEADQRLGMSWHEWTQGEAVPAARWTKPKGGR